MQHTFANTKPYLKTESKSYSFARLFSDAVNPLFIPPVLMSLCCWLIQAPAFETALSFTLTLIFYTAIPMVAIFKLLKINGLRSRDIPLQRSRNKIFLISFISAIAGILPVYFVAGSTYSVIAISYLTLLLNIVSGFVVNLYKKISIHAAGISSAGTFLFIFAHLEPVPFTAFANILSLIFLLVLLPLMIWARHHLKAHNWPELAGGTIAGIFFTTFYLSLLTSIW